MGVLVCPSRFGKAGRSCDLSGLGFFQNQVKKAFDTFTRHCTKYFFIAEVSPRSLLYVTKQRLRNGPIYRVPGIYMPWRAANWSVTGPSYSKNVLVEHST